jgi:cytochrome P450
MSEPATLIRDRADALPPGPDTPAIGQAVRYHRDPLGELRRQERRYGPIFTVRWPGRPPIVVVAVAELASEILGSDPRSAHAGEARRVVLPLASHWSPFGADGDAHEEARARSVRYFSAERVTTIAPDIRALADEQASHWPTGRAFRLLPRLRTLTTTVLVRLVLGVDDPVRERALVAAIRHLLWTPGNPPFPVPSPDDGPAGRAVAAIFRRRLAWVRRALPDCGFDVDEWAVVFAAAQEPPAIALTNVLLELAARPEAQERVVGGDGEYLELFVREVLRLRPPAAGALRRLTAPMEVEGHVLAPGTVLLLPFPLVQRDPAAFAEPDRFRPERWASASADKPCFPFGDGARRCLGEVLGRTELSEAVPTVLRRLHLLPTRSEPERMVVRATVLVPHRSGLVTTRPRRPKTLRQDLRPDLPRE